MDNRTGAFSKPFDPDAYIKKAEGCPKGFYSGLMH